MEFCEEAFGGAPDIRTLKGKYCLFRNTFSELNVKCIYSKYSMSTCYEARGNKTQNFTSYSNKIVI